jgi:hypothetical protein
VSFCNHTTGDYYAITSENVHYDMLRSALTAGKSVQVGFYDFGKDPQSGGYEELYRERYASAVSRRFGTAS